MRSLLDKLVLITLLLIIFSCKEYSIEEFELYAEEIDGLVRVSIIAPEEGDVLMEVTQSNRLIFKRSFVNQKSINHNLFQLEQDQEYKMTASYKIGEESYTKSIIYLKRAPAENLNVIDSVLNTSESSSYYLVKPFNLELLLVLNNKGETVIGLDNEIGKMRGFSISDDSTIVFLSDSTTIKEMSFQGELINQISLKQFDEFEFNLHHDLKKFKGNYYAIVDNKGHFSVNDDTFRDEGFVQISGEGELLRFFNIAQGNSLYNYNLNATSFTGHCNSIALDEYSNVYLSLRNVNQVWKINPDNDVVWSMGLNAKEYPIDLSDSFLGQHSIKILAQDNFWIYDNSAYKKKENAKIRKLEIDQSKLMNNVSLRLASELSTVRMGSVDITDEIFTVSAFNNGFHIVDYSNNEEINHLVLNQKAKSIKVYRLSEKFLDEVLNRESALK